MTTRGELHDMHPINLAVIGSGFMGAAHVDGLRRVPGVNVMAISSIDRPRADELARDFAIPHVFDDWRDILRQPEITAVHHRYFVFLAAELRRVGHPRRR